jgi:Zn-dependent M28 family amino/carboxypeptidase
MEVIHTLKQLGLHPKRTIRMIAWMNEENGGRGARAYEASEKANAEKHIAAYEDDNGSGRPFGIKASITPQAVKYFAPLQHVLQQIGAGAFHREDALGTGDLFGLEHDGVPSFEPVIDSSDYFNYHHTPADTFDKVNPDNLRRHAAVMATTAWFLANTDQPVGRANVLPDDAGRH